MSTFAIIAGCIVGVSIALLLLLVYTIGHMRGSCGRCSICKERFANIWPRNSPTPSQATFSPPRTTGFIVHPCSKCGWHGCKCEKVAKP